MTQSDLTNGSIYLKLITLMLQAKRQMAAAAESWQLTPVQAMLLLSLDSSARTMHQLSDTMGCDASNITGLVDRLEAAGYIRRTADPSDRRIKAICLTASGATCQNRLLQALQASEAVSLARLSPAEQSRLLRLLTKLS